MCPFHSERTPSFSIDPNRQTFYCFGCQDRGDVITYIQRRDSCSFKQALAVLGIKGDKPALLKFELRPRRTWDDESPEDRTVIISSVFLDDLRAGKIDQRNWPDICRLLRGRYTDNEIKTAYSHHFTAEQLDELRLAYRKRNSR